VSASNGNLTMRDRAVELARQGFPVFPLRAGTKDKPVVPSGHPQPPKGRYFDIIPSADESRVWNMWTNAAGGPLDYNIGICTNDLLVPDLDVKDGKDGVKAFPPIAKELGLSEITLTTITPSGGQHRFYKLPNGGKARNTVGELGEGVDTRGWHGYVVAPGSVVPEGEYRWMVPPGEIEMATATEAALDRVRFTGESAKAREAVDGLELDSPAAIERATKWLINDAPEATEGFGGDNMTFQIACVVRDFGIEEQTCLELMVEHWNDTKAHPPWPIDQLEQKVANAYSYAQNPIGAKSAEADFGPVELEEPVKGDKATEGDSDPAASRKPRLFWRREEDARARWETGAVSPLIANYLGKGEMSVLYGDSNTGKTFVVLDWAYHIAMRRSWNGNKVNGGLVVYVAAEASESINARLEALYRRYKPEGKLPLAVVPCPVDLSSPKADLKPLLALLEEISKAYGMRIAFVVLDTLARVIGDGDESSAKDMGLLVQSVDRIRVITGAHTNLVHHSGKNTAKGARGSSALRAATDTEIEIEGNKIYVRKQRNGEQAEAVGFRLVPVALGKSRDGEAVTSCTIEVGAAVDFEPQETHEEQGDGLETLKRVIRMLELTQFTTEDMQAAWQCASSTARRKARQLVYSGDLEIVAKGPRGTSAVYRFK
jgi:hypothetical protein